MHFHEIFLVIDIVIVSTFAFQNGKKFGVHHGVHVFHQLRHQKPISVGHFVFFQSNFLDDFAVIESL